MAHVAGYSKKGVSDRVKINLSAGSFPKA